MKGIITTKLSAKIRTDAPFAPGAEIRIFNKLNEQLLPVFYISKPGFGGGIAEIVAYDNCRALDYIFDTSGYFREERDYPALQVINAAAAQCGFGGAVNFEPNIDFIPYKYIKGKTCRSIALLLSEVNCGVWFCNNYGQLEFKQFGAVTDLCTANASVCSEFRVGAVKGPVSSIQFSNPVTDENYELGIPAGFNSKIKLSGKLIGRDEARKLISQINGKEYRAFTCKKIRTMLIPQPLCGFEYNGVIYNAASIITDITPSGYYSTVRSPVISEDRFDYVGTLEYSLAERIMQEKQYGCSVISASGLQFADGENRYGFTARTGGVTVYDGSMTSAVPAENITVNDSAAELSYTSGGIRTDISVVWNGDNISSYSRRMTDGEGNVIFDDTENNE